MGAVYKILSVVGLILVWTMSAVTYLVAVCVLAFARLVALVVDAFQLSNQHVPTMAIGETADEAAESVGITLDQLRALETAGFILIRSGSTAIHKKRGCHYDVLGDAEVQSSKPIKEGDTVTVYVNQTTNKMWARISAEFVDGRFKITPRAIKEIS